MAPLAPIIAGLSLQEQAALAMRLHGPSGSLHLGGLGMGPGQQQLVGSGLNGGGGGLSLDMSLGGEGDPNENPPVGCNPDAIKLFIGNVPKSFTEEQLCPFFETAGQVRSFRRSCANFGSNTVKPVVVCCFLLRIS